MKKITFILLLAFLASVKTTWGQVSITYLDISYEYHPYINEIVSWGQEPQNIHSGRLGITGFAFIVGKHKNIGLEWTPINLMLSPLQFSVCYLNFSIRAEKGRFCPCINMHLVEFEKKRKDIKESKSIIHHSLSGGFEFYISNISLLTFNVGLRIESSFDRLSPFVGIGYKLDIDTKK